jgi:uncharacterized protein YerC
MRREISKIREREKQATLAALYKAAERIKGEASVQTFINDILTESERITIGRRLLIANLILTGQTYSEIHNQLGVSPNTFSRIRQWLTGRFPDYDQTLKDTYPVSSKTRADYTKAVPFSFAHLEKKYPLHYLLFTLSRKVITDLKSK